MILVRDDDTIIYRKKLDFLFIVPERRIPLQNKAVEPYDIETVPDNDTSLWDRGRGGG